MSKAKILVALAIFAVFITVGFLFNPKIEAYGNNIGHPKLTEKIAELYNYIYGPDLTQEEIDLLIQGASDEDTPPRWINHFYDPNTGQGWLGKRLGGDISEETVRQIAKIAFNKESVSALNWANNQELQNSQYSLYQGNRAFDSAVLYYSEGKKEEAYYTLGYILHLVEDMTVPAHTRQDTHFDILVPDIFEQLTGMQFDKGEPYEKWVEEDGGIDQNTMNILKNNYQPICSSLDSCLIYLANYSNNNFFSQDSILDKEYAGPVVVRYVIVNDKKYAYGRNNQLLFISESNPYRKNSDIKIASESYWRNLSPVAILAGVEVVKYFQGQVEKAKNHEIALTRPGKISLVDKIKSISPYGELARLVKYASAAVTNPLSLWWNYEQQDNGVKNQSPSLITDLGLTPEEAQERADDLQELLDLLNNREDGDNFSLPRLELPSLPAIELPSLEPPTLGLPSLEIPPLLQDQTQNQTPAQLTNSSGGQTSGGSGGGGGSSTSTITYPKILISEVKIAEKTSDKDIFIELFNTNSSEVDLTKWYLFRNDSSFITKTLFENKKIPPSGYLLIARDGSIWQGQADVIFGGTLNENDKITLKNPNGEMVDEISWSQIAAGFSFGRKWSGQNYLDFENQIPTPKAQNVSPAPPPATPPAPPAPPAPTDTAAPTATFNLEAVQTTLNFTVNFEITDLSIENVSPSGLAAFQFRWEEEGGEWQEDVEQAIAGTAVIYQGARDFTGQDEKKYYFQVKAKDVNGNESIWLPETPAETWIRAVKVILINEIQISGQTTKDEFVELYNPNNYDVNLLNYALKKKTASGNESYLVSASAFTGTIPALGFFLIVPQPNEDGTPNYTGSAAPDLYYSGKDYSIAADNTVLLYNNFGDLVDKVGMGGVADFETSPTVNPGAGQSIERVRLGSDTDNNSQDFRVSTAPTPKQPSSRQLYTLISADFTEDAVLTKSLSPYVFDRIITISEGKTLTIEPGVVIKFNNFNTGLLVNGTLKAIGEATTEGKIVFTSFLDDEYGGDTNLDAGLQSGQPGQWSGLKFAKTSINSELENVVVRFAGYRYNFDFEAGIKVDRASISLKNSIIQNNSNNGLWLINSPSLIDSVQILDNKWTTYEYIYGKGIYVQGGSPTVINSYFKGNYQGIIITKWYDAEQSLWVPVSAVVENNDFEENWTPISVDASSHSSLADNQAINNDFNGIVMSGSVEIDTTWRRFNLVYIVKDDLIRVDPGITLTIEPGVILKFNNFNMGLLVNGTLKAIGTADNPIVFTSNNATPQPGQWCGLRFTNTSIDSELEHVIIHYAGAVFTSDFGAGLKVDRASISLKNSIIQNNSNNGLWLINSPSLIDSVQILDNKWTTYQEINGKGIYVNGGSPTISNSLIAGNHFGIYMASWYDENGTEVPAIPIIETNNTIQDNTVDIFPPPPTL